MKKLREKAIKRYINGESPKEIYRSLGKGKTWFFKWLKRYRLDGTDWAVEHSRRPHKSPKQIDQETEQMVIATRKELENILYVQIGASNIDWQLRQEGMKPPSIATINRILKRNDLVRKREKYVPKGTPYPAPCVIRSNDLHQLDVIGPRYLKGDGRFYAINVIDAHDRRGSNYPHRRKNRRAILGGLLYAWHRLGLPFYLQMDNFLPCRGSNRYPHSFGIIIRLCLYLGIQPVFIPIGEPWRNGIVEHFQFNFDRKFFRSQSFAHFEELCEKAREFEQFHNRQHRYSTLGGLTPYQKCTGNIKHLPDSFRLPEQLAISPGYVHLIRLIRSNHLLDVFGERFAVPADLEYEYVWATIDTAKERLDVYHDHKLMIGYAYPLPKSSMLLPKIA
jgi:putative transposase